VNIRSIAVAVLLFGGAIYGQTGPAVTPADYLRWRTEVRNWGRWGPNDQKGTANLITPQKVQSAARLVLSGEVVSLAGAVPQQEAAARAATAFSSTRRTARSRRGSSRPTT